MIHDTSGILSLATPLWWKKPSRTAVDSFIDDQRDQELCQLQMIMEEFEPHTRINDGKLRANDGHHLTQPPAIILVP